MVVFSGIAEQPGEENEAGVREGNARRTLSHLESVNDVSPLRRVVSPACSLALSSLSVFLIYVVQTKVQSLVLSCVFGGVSVITWNSLDVVGTELYPTQLRYILRSLFFNLLSDLNPCNLIVSLLTILLKLAT